MAKKVKGKAKGAKPAARRLGPPPEGQVWVEVLQDYENHKKGDILQVPERKVRDSARLLRKGFIKPL